jgi:DNA-binding MarR family transcriptional regulator
MSQPDAAGRPAANADALGTPARTADQLHSAAIHLLRWLRQQDDASGLTAPRLSALSVVVFGGPLTLGALAAAEQVRPPTMTRIVTALQTDGLVERVPSRTDGRAVLIQATPAGHRLLVEGRLRRTATLAERLARLSAADQAALERAATLIEQLARERPITTEGPTPPADLSASQ